MRTFTDDKHLRHLNNRKMIKWRKCKKCLKKQELRTTPGNWKWVKTNKKLPDKSNVIDVEIYQLGYETKRRKRDKLIKELLK